MKCGHCKGKHETVGQARLCAQTVLPGVKHTTPTSIKNHVAITEAGMYRVADVVYLVEGSKKNPGRFYAKKLIPTYLGNGTLHRLNFQYDKGAIFQINPSHRMTVADVAALGKLTGRCWVCRHKLTVQKSIEAGIGPVCAKKV